MRNIVLPEIRSCFALLTALMGASACLTDTSPGATGGGGSNAGSAEPNASSTAAGEVAATVGGSGTGGASGSPGSASTAAGGSGSGTGCANGEVQEVQFEVSTPTVVMLIDQSGSMTEPLVEGDEGGPTRWATVRDALIDPDEGVVARLEDEVRFGLALYTSIDGHERGGECPLIVEQAPALGNYEDLSSVYLQETPADDTPTGESVEAVAAALALDPSEGPKVLVLATDGAPDTCAEPSNQTAQPQSVEAVENAYAAGIETFVISVGTDLDEWHLQDLANAGVGWAPGDPNAIYYVPSDQDAMVAAFEDVINGARSCVLTLETPIVLGENDQGTVTVNGEEVELDDPDGWRVNNPTQIELLGESCEAIAAGEVEVTVEFTCEAFAGS